MATLTTYKKTKVENISHPTKLKNFLQQTVQMQEKALGLGMAVDNGMKSLQARPEVKRPTV